MELFKKALSYKDDFAELHSNIGTILLEDGRIDEACDAFKEALGIDPGFVVARRNLGYCHFRQNDVPAAGAEFLSVSNSIRATVIVEWGLGLFL